MPQRRSSSETMGLDGFRISDEEAERRATRWAAARAASDARIKGGTTSEMFRLEPPRPIPRNEKARGLLSPRADSRDEKS